MAKSKRPSIPKKMDLPFDAERMYAGFHCPKCEQWTKLYARRINKGMATQLIWLVRTYKKLKRNWVKVANHAPRNILSSPQFTVLKHWGLVEQKENLSSKKRTSNLWRPTKAGIDFVLQRISVPEYAFLYNDKLRGYSVERTTLEQALGVDFDYEEVMASWGEPVVIK